jgi:hypothetical protein
MVISFSVASATSWHSILTFVGKILGKLYASFVRHRAKYEAKKVAKAFAEAQQAKAPKSSPLLCNDRPWCYCSSSYIKAKVFEFKLYLTGYFFKFLFRIAFNIDFDA